MEIDFTFILFFMETKCKFLVEENKDTLILLLWYSRLQSQYYK